MSEEVKYFIRLAAVIIITAGIVWLLLVIPLDEDYKLANGCEITQKEAK